MYLMQVCSINIYKYLLQLTIKDMVATLINFTWNKEERIYQCKEDTWLHFAQNISNLWRKAFIRVDNLSETSFASVKTTDRYTNEQKAYSLWGEISSWKKNQRWWQTSHTHPKCQPMKEWIINNLQPALLCEQKEQRILGKNTWAVLCAPDYITSGQISKQNPHFSLKALQKSILKTPALNIKGIFLQKNVITQPDVVPNL